jgi:hypothetical protein
MKWQDLPKEIQEKMLERQFEQKGKRDASVFEECISNGFEWRSTPEDSFFWSTILIDNNISHFYTLYPKQDYPKVMMVSDYRFDNDNKGHKAVVFAKKCERYIAWDCETIEDAERTTYTSTWKYAKDIESIPSYTMEELFEKIGKFNLIK